MPDAADRRFLVKVSVVMAALVVLVTAVAFGWRPALIAYHKRRMAKALKKGTWGPSRGGLGQKMKGLAYSSATGRPYRPTPAFDESREALVRLGYFERREFHLRHFRRTTAAMNLLWKRMMAAFDCPLHVQNLSCMSEETQRFAVCDRPERMAAWKEFFAEHDVPDFMQRFGPGGSGK